MAVIRIGLPPTTAAMRPALEKAMTAASILATSIIKRRTAQGMSADGGPFAPYTRDYAKKKAGTGRSVGRVDLTLSGQLLGNLKLLRIEWRGNTPVGFIGFTGQHAGERLDKVGKVIVSADRTPGIAAVMTKARVVQGRKLRNGERATHSLTRTTKSVPMATIVLGLSKKRPFFSVRRPEEIKQLVATFQRVFRAELAQLKP